VVHAIGVVVVDVAGEVAFETGEADVEVAGEGWAPAFFEDQPREGLDVAVGLGTTGADEGVAVLSFAIALRKSLERNSPLLSVSTRSSCLPAWRTAVARWAPAGLSCRPVIFREWRAGAWGRVRPVVWATISRNASISACRAERPARVALIQVRLRFSKVLSTPLGRRPPS
jgi:hypothetical protein